jgi:hypothetical protein
MVGDVVGDGVFPMAVGAAGLVFCAVMLTAIVWYAWVKLGVVVLTGNLLAEIRVITCHNRKMIPAATANQTINVSRLNRRGVRLVLVINTAP